ncbi:3579_t:CDS:2 [Entrophospora sp. SA101]|nr:3579_t:CDS:2 [Entrophospora sp. SA101]
MLLGVFYECIELWNNTFLKSVTSQNHIRIKAEELGESKEIADEFEEASDRSKGLREYDKY